MSKILENQEIISYKIVVDSYGNIDSIINEIKEKTDQVEASALYDEKIESNKKILNYNNFGLSLIIAISIIFLYYLLKYIYRDSIEDIRLLKILGANSLKIDFHLLIKKQILFFISIILLSILLFLLKIFSLKIHLIYYSFLEIIILIGMIIAISFCFLIFTTIIDYFRIKKV